MDIFKSFVLTISACAAALSVTSCGGGFSDSDYTAYFGGEVTNPMNPYVLFYKDDKLIDSIRIDDKNRFFVKFDSLAPGMYTFRHDPEYQYVYFDKNDSLMVTINPQDFDESIVFSGRGDQKNNFLMELYLMTEKDRDNMFPIYDYDADRFNKAIDSMHRRNTEFFEKKRADVNWGDEFDTYARAALDFPHFSKKELYPVIHRVRTGNDIFEKLPKGYYDFRKQIDYNNAALSSFSPFVQYLSVMLNNLSTIKYHHHLSQDDVSLKTNINKLDIADTLIKNEKIKNTMLNNIAFTYLLEDQNMANNQLFLDTYQKYSTDKSQENEITRIGAAIRKLSPGKVLPAVALVSIEGKAISSVDLLKDKTVLFFWSEFAVSHLEEAHKKALAFQKKYPGYKFIAINCDDNQQRWVKFLGKYRFDGIQQLRTLDFEDMRTRWAITKIHRTIVLGENAVIENAFTNLFNNSFEENLKE